MLLLWLWVLYSGGLRYLYVQITDSTGNTPPRPPGDLIIFKVATSKPFFWKIQLSIVNSLIPQ